MKTNQRNRISETLRSRLNRLTGILTGVTLALGFAFSAVGVGSAEAADFQAYSISGSPIAGNQAFVGGLGLDFDVNSPITISSLGVFDDNADGIAGTIDVHIFDLSDTSAPLASETFTVGQGDLMGQFRFKDITALTLGVGSYSVVTFGFGGADNNGNEAVADIPLVTDDGGGLISFVNSRWLAAVDPLATFPTSLAIGSPGAACSGDPEACFAAGSFKYASAEPDLATAVTKELVNGPNDNLGQPIAVDIDEFDAGGILVLSPDSQHFEFKITITNVGENGALDGLKIFDVVGAEFDPDPGVEETVGANSCVETDCDGIEVTGDGTCTASITPNDPDRKMDPHFIVIEVVDLFNGESCMVTVWVKTVENPSSVKKTGPGDDIANSSEKFSPTSCDLVMAGDPDLFNTFTLNEGVKVFDPESGIRLLGPVGSLQLTCNFPD